MRSHQSYKTFCVEQCDALDFECPTHVRHSLFYDWKHYLKQFGLGSAAKPGEDEDDRLNESINFDAICTAANGFDRVCSN